MALVQIRSSNGTQTGRAFAILGILLALAFGGTTGVKAALAQAQQRREEAAIGKAIELLGQRLINREYEQAYGALFSDKFREDFPKDEFMTRWEDLDRDAGAIQSVTWGGRAEFLAPRATGGRRARAKAIFKFEKAGESTPMTVAFIDQEGEWVIEGLGEIFNAEAERQREQQRAPTGSPIMGPQFPGAQ